ncbi:MAG: 1-acyl-sn-glycerol-3-phosphate acyltransferase [Oscillospiraceae bacterium]|nr:1-acyl-sn-glycerol-3-phosphate acyltransferase [Oscillospiraceae bacterium]
MLLGGIAVVSLILALLFCVLGQGALWAGLLVFAGAYLVLMLIAFLFLVTVCNLVDLEKEQEEDDPFYRAVMYLYVEALISLVLVRLKATGLEKTPKEGRFLLVCNHLFLADPGILLHCFKKSQLAFITKKENQQMFVVGKIMHKILCQPLDRENDRAALKTILKCIQLIKEDKVSVGVFPEGYTSKDGKLHRFRPGAFKIAQKANVPIVVCTIQGTRQIFKNLAKLKHTDVELHLVDVIPAEELKGKTTVEISDRVYETMIADLGESFRAEE